MDLIIRTYFVQILNTSDKIYLLNWYTYTPSQQRFILLAIQQTQQATYMDGLGILECSLESFTAVGHDLQYYFEGLELTVLNSCSSSSSFCFHF